MDENKQGEETTDKLVEAQLKKLNLEIESLELKNSWDKGRTKYISALTVLASIITALVAIAGVWLSINKYFNDREQERIAATQAQRRADQDYFHAAFNQVIELVNPGMRNVSMNSQSGVTRQSLYASQHYGLVHLSNIELSMKEIIKLQTLLEDLNSVVARLPEENKKRVTNTLIDSIERLNFANTHHVQIDIAVIEHWKNYEEYLKAHEKINNSISLSYTGALSQVHDKAPQFFESMRIDPYSGRLGHDSYFDEELLSKFVAILNGFGHHVRMMDRNSEGRKYLIKRFQSAVNNPVFTEQFFEENPFFTEQG